MNRYDRLARKVIDAAYKYYYGVDEESDMCDADWDASLRELIAHKDKITIPKFAAVIEDTPSMHHIKKEKFKALLK
jgi:NAD-dependent DNA ligase